MLREMEPALDRAVNLSCRRVEKGYRPFFPAVIIELQEGVAQFLGRGKAAKEFLIS